jgi:cell division protein FtsL
MTFMNQRQFSIESFEINSVINNSHFTTLEKVWLYTVIVTEVNLIVSAEHMNYKFYHRNFRVNHIHVHINSYPTPLHG